jgi:succinate dehydrogenase/fumarate reductase flavoprotein subunit
MMHTQTSRSQHWDCEADLVIVGFGGAGAATAITAADAGASVILLDKAPKGEEGGNTRVAAQGYLNTSTPERAKIYLNALCGPHTVPQDMVDVWADEMCKNNDWLRQIGGDPQEHHHQPAGIEFPELPGSDCVHKFHHGDRLGYSKTWEFLAQAVRDRSIDVRYATPGRRLIQDPLTQAVIGVEAESAGQIIRIKARKSVVLTCGGFENNQEMIREFLPGMRFCYTSGSPYNEGDGVRMGMEVGADLWHMNNFAGPSMALKVPDYPTTFSMKALHFSHEPPGGMIVIGPDGKRFTDEKYKTRHGKVKKPCGWTALDTPCPMFMIFDQTLFDDGPIYDAKPTHGWTQIMSGYQWSKDNHVELAKGWIKSASTLQALAAQLGLPVDNLSGSVMRWNSMCAAGVDSDFRRSLMLAPFGNGPYYAVELSPSMLNTQGGPRRNARAQVVRPDGTPIPRLYSAGELGSIYGYLYQGTGNIGECFAFGRIAARHSINETPQ